MPRPTFDLEEKKYNRLKKILIDRNETIKVFFTNVVDYIIEKENKKPGKNCPVCEIEK